MNTQKWSIYTALVIFCGIGQIAYSDCMPLTKDVQTRITNYLSQRIASGTGASALVLSDVLVPNSCYRELSIRMPGVSDPIKLYLSPDQKFIAGTLYNLDIDPKEEVSEIAAEVDRLLLRDKSPQLSGANSQITIVEFADFQCPYCRQFESWYDSLPPSLLEQTTLIYKHLPLPQHAWARLAAEYAACADSQRSKAFWHLARYLFSHQDMVTPQNFKGEIESAFADMPDIDVPKLFECSANGNGGLIVERDAELAKQLAVSGTPTLFVDGLRVMPMHSRDELQQFLKRKLKTNVASRGQEH